MWYKVRHYLETLQYYATFLIGLNYAFFIYSDCLAFPLFFYLSIRMRAVIQRVSEASVTIEGNITGQIEKGLLVLLGIAPDDTREDIDWLIKKMIQLRIFNDEEGKMNLSIQDVKGDFLIVSQFTLFADCKKGNRPSYTRSAPPMIAIPLYERFLAELKKQFEGKVEAGIFGADMKVRLLNDGPVTILLDTRNKDNI